MESLLQRGRDAMAAASRFLRRLLPRASRRLAARGPVEGRGAADVQEKQAFAVYCDADRSLRFYRRAEVPQEGESFEGRTVDEVYTGHSFTDGAMGAPLLRRRPWGHHAYDVETVEVVDEGIAPESTARWFSAFERMAFCDLSKLDTSRVTSMAAMFDECWSLESLDLSGFDTSNVGDMNWMFRRCSSLESLDLSGFDTGNVKDMHAMFAYCSSLAALDLSGFDTSRTENMAYMFAGCESLKELDLSGFDTARVEDMTGMFRGCSSVKTLDLSDFDTGNVEDMSSMFEDCKSLTGLDLASFDTGNVKYMHTMFAYCSSLAALDLSGFETGNVEDMGDMFRRCSRLVSLDLSGFDTSRTEDMAYMFTDCKSLASLDLSGFDTGRVETTGGMFFGCARLESLNLSGFDPVRVEGISDMFYGCDSLPAETLRAIEAKIAGEAPQEKQAFAVYCDADKSLRFYRRAEVPQEGESFEGQTVDAVYPEDAFSPGEDGGHPWDVHAQDVETVEVVDEGIAPSSTAYWLHGFDRMTSCDLSKLDTSNVTSMTDMFDGCSSLESLDLSGFDTSHVVSMAGMFDGCASVESIDLSGFDTSGVKSMTGMFRDCESLRKLDLSGFDTENVRSMCAMFERCRSLQKLDLSSFDTSHVDLMLSMFQGCSSLKELDLSSFDTSHVEDMDCMFYNCSALKDIDLSGFDLSSIMDQARDAGRMFDGCDSLSAETVWAFDEKVAIAALSPLETAILPLYRESDDECELVPPIEALERRAQGFPAEERGWTMRSEDGRTAASENLVALFEGAEVCSINEDAGRLLVTFTEEGLISDAEIRLSPSPDAGWDDCEPPHVALWTTCSGEPMQWVIGACPTEAELVGAETGGTIRAVATADGGGTWSATVSDAGREIRLGGAVCADSAAQFAEAAESIEGAMSGTLASFASARGIDGEALLADWARESRGADPEKTGVLDAVETLGPLSAYARDSSRPAVQDAGRTVEAVRAGAEAAGIYRAEEMGAARAASVDAAVSMMAKGANGFAVVYRDLAFAPAADDTWTVMKQSAEGSFSPFEAGWRPGALSFDEQAASADVAKMGAATSAECNAGGWRDAGVRAAEAPAKEAPGKRAQAPARVDPALLADAGALGASSRGAR